MVLNGEKTREEIMAVERELICAHKCINELKARLENLLNNEEKEEFENTGSISSFTRGRRRLAHELLELLQTAEKKQD